MEAPKKWSETEDSRLREMWAQGLSTQAIGERISRSKNCVVGRVRRLGLVNRPSPIIRKEIAPGVYAELKKKDNYRQKPIDPATRVANFPKPRTYQLIKQKRLEAIRIPKAIVVPPARMCQFPLWSNAQTDTAKRLYCEIPSKAGFSYCPKHYELCYVGKPDRSSSETPYLRSNYLERRS